MLSSLPLSEHDLPPSGSLGPFLPLHWLSDGLVTPLEPSMTFKCIRFFTPPMVLDSTDLLFKPSFNTSSSDASLLCYPICLYQPPALCVPTPGGFSSVRKNHLGAYTNMQNPVVLSPSLLPLRMIPNLHRLSLTHPAWPWPSQKMLTLLPTSRREGRSGSLRGTCRSHPVTLCVCQQGPQRSMARRGSPFMPKKKKACSPATLLLRPITRPRGDSHQQLP